MKLLVLILQEGRVNLTSQEGGVPSNVMGIVWSVWLPGISYSKSNDITNA